MAPDIRLQQDSIETELRSLIETIYKIITQIGKHAGDATTAALEREVQSLLQRYTTILRLASTTTTTNPEGAPASTTSLLVPPDVIEYVQEGRNPDIYTREFVELAMRNNQRLSGKMAAFAQFRDVLATEISGGVPQLAKDVEKVVVHTGGAWPLPSLYAAATAAAAAAESQRKEEEAVVVVKSEDAVGGGDGGAGAVAIKVEDR